MVVRMALLNGLRPNRRDWLLLCMATLPATGCQRSTPNEALASPASGTVDMNRKEDAVSRFDQILELLWNTDEKVRENGMRDLADFRREIKAPGSQIGLKALRNAARPYGFEKPEPGSVSADLVAVAQSTPLPEYIPVVVEHFAKFSDEAKWQAQLLITELQSREAAMAFMTIVRSHAADGRLSSLCVARLANKPRHAEVLFPEILNYANNRKLSFEIYWLCLAYCEANLLPPGKLAPFTEQVLKSYSDVAAKLRPAQKDRGIAWMWEEAYEESRRDGALLLDLLGYFPGDLVEKPLREALQYQDPRLKYFALISLIRLGKPFDKKAVEDVAGHALMRNRFYIRLNQLGKASFFPEKFRTQKSFAESDMVNWLVYPTELNRVPDEIELMKVVTIDTELPDGVYDYYLYRFRTEEPHWAAKDGWMAGVSGPFRKKDQPTTEALGDTFSTFTKWSSKTPEEHVGDIQELMKTWREYHSRNKH